MSTQEPRVSALGNIPLGNIIGTTTASQTGSVRNSSLLGLPKTLSSQVLAGFTEDKLGASRCFRALANLKDNVDMEIDARALQELTCICCNLLDKYSSDKVLMEKALLGIDRLVEMQQPLCSHNHRFGFTIIPSSTITCTKCDLTFDKGYVCKNCHETCCLSCNNEKLENFPDWISWKEDETSERLRLIESIINVINIHQNEGDLCNLGLSLISKLDYHPFTDEFLFILANLMEKHAATIGNNGLTVLYSLYDQVSDELVVSILLGISKTLEKGYTNPKIASLAFHLILELMKKQSHEEMLLINISTGSGLNKSFLYEIIIRATFCLSFYSSSPTLDPASKEIPESIILLCLQLLKNISHIQYLNLQEFKFARYLLNFGTLNEFCELLRNCDNSKVVCEVLEILEEAFKSEADSPDFLDYFLEPVILLISQLTMTKFTNSVEVIGKVLGILDFLLLSGFQEFLKNEDFFLIPMLKKVITDQANVLQTNQAIEILRQLVYSEEFNDFVTNELVSTLVISISQNYEELDNVTPILKTFKELISNQAFLESLKDQHDLADSLAGILIHRNTDAEVHLMLLDIMIGFCKSSEQNRDRLLLQFQEDHFKVRKALFLLWIK